MSWVMADRVGQSEHHYSAGFFFPLTTAVKHFAELFTSLSVGIRGKATVGCGVWLHLMLKKILMKETDCRGLMKHEYIMSLLWLDASLPL